MEPHWGLMELFGSVTLLRKSQDIKNSGQTVCCLMACSQSRLIRYKTLIGGNGEDYMVSVFCYKKVITSFHSPRCPLIHSLSPNIFSDSALIDVAFHMLYTLMEW